VAPTLLEVTKHAIESRSIPPVIVLGISDLTSQLLFFEYETASTLQKGVPSNLLEIFHHRGQLGSPHEVWQRFLFGIFDDLHN
jgi:hypothetical protein